MNAPDNVALRIGAWHVAPALDEISKDGKTVKLQPKTMQVLVCLAAHAGQVVSVEQLLDEVWKDLVVTPNSVYQAIAELRRVLGDDAKQASYIANVLRRGYRLVAPVGPWMDTAPIPSESLRSDAAVASKPEPPRTRWPVGWSSLALVVAIVLALAYFVVGKFGSTPRQTAIGEEQAGDSRSGVDKSVAVLPFLDLSERKDQEYFADGLSEELIYLLTKVPGLHVPARTSSFYFKGKQVTIAAIAKALGVTHVLEGSVRKSGNTIRVTAELVRADNGYPVWSETFDRQLDDIFKLQDEIAGAVVKALSVSLMEGVAARATPTSNTEAYTLYLQARSIAAGRAADADYGAANNYLQRVVALDPNFASAWAALANIVVDEYSWRHSRPYMEAEEQARSAAVRALQIDPKLSDGHLAMAKILFTFDFDWEGSEAEYRRALEIDPGNADALRWKSYLALVLNRSDQALQLAEKAVSDDPLNSWNFFAVAAAHSASGRFADSEAAYRKGLELNPTGVGLHALLGEVLVLKGEAAAGLTQIQHESDDMWQRISLPFALDALGRRSEADEELATLESRYADLAPAAIGYLYACRRDTDRTILWLDRAFQRRILNVFSATRSCLKNVDSDPRYAALLGSMKLSK